MPTTLSVYDAKAKFSAVKPILLDTCAVLWLAGNIPVVTADRRFAQYSVETLK